MAQGIIYMVDETGALRRMRPSAPASEDHMQALVARYPELITDGDGDLLLIRREHPIPDGIESGGRWSLDHLFVTRDAVPVLVELKRAVDTRLRREVVGQILDYAANSTAYWQAGRIAEAFSATARAADLDPDETLAKFLGEGDHEAFWSQVDSNFKAGRIKLVFVADNIPRELARIVEFLNDQMRAEVRAVELRWFSGDGEITTLSPRVIGETERSASAKTAAASLESLEREPWIAKHLAPFGEEVVAASETFIRIVEEEGGEVHVASTQGSIYALFRDVSGRAFYPFNVSYYGKGQLVLVLASLKSVSPFLSDDARLKLYRRAVEAVGHLSTGTLTGYPGVPVTRLNDGQVAERFRALLQDIRQMALGQHSLGDASESLDGN